MTPASLSRRARAAGCLLLLAPALALDLLLYLLLRKLPETPPSSGRGSIWKYGFTHLFI